MAALPLIDLPVDVWSDIACPWCYVGKARLDAAIQSVQLQQPTRQLQVSVKWHPYMIDVRTNPTGEEYLAYNKRRWGSDSWTHSLRRSAARNGLQFGDWKWWPNTLHAHRLVRLASSRGQGTEAKDLLLRKTYEEGQNISDPKVLCAAADELGIEGARTYLESGEGTDEIVEEDSDAKRARGISGVPYFLIDNRYVLKGAQEVEALKDALERALLRRQQEDQGTGASP